ncbi:MAG: hypothetical protein PUF37_06880 [Prevotellaceae bacterium]|nr:hypothetical protein [Prevotellaceae bacterium]
MKKFLSLFALLAFLVLPASAQDVLNYVAKEAEKICNDTTLDIQQRKVAVFKYDECSYLKSKMAPKMMSDSVSIDEKNRLIKEANEQVYNMVQYLTVYEKRLKDCKKKNRELITATFKKATLDCPLFKDNDEDLVHAYSNRTDYPTPFSLDCDWSKALQLIRGIDWSKY